MNRNEPDKNLINTVKELETTPVNSLDAQQQQQARNDRSKMALHDGDEKYNESESDNHR
ncbi:MULTISPECIES: hypothetical protein [Paenibacillus]|uniref:hypothetical protein n=1 Tax=Paenibacillus TaxID=44249 RepID=UPI0015956E41|nr:MULTISPECIES: hypothetical protein [Paenibacillus]